MLKKRMTIPLGMLALCGSATFARAAYTTVTSSVYGPYCPDHIGGDREYNGHGPEVNATITLSRSNGNRDINTIFHMHQIETTWDWSEAELDRTERIATAPINSTYTQVWMPRNDTWQWVSLGSSPEIDSVDVSYTDHDHAVDIFSNPKWFVLSVAIIGDTSGKDIGNCTSDDASLKATLNTLYFWYQ
jgi:hypothetical protein